MIIEYLLQRLRAFQRLISEDPCQQGNKTKQNQTQTSKSLASWSWRVWTAQLREPGLEYTSQVRGCFHGVSWFSLNHNKWLVPTRLGIELTLKWQYKLELNNMWLTWVRTLNLRGICKVCFHLALGAPGELETTQNCREFEGEQHWWTEMKHYSVQSLKNWLAKLFDKALLPSCRQQLALWAGSWVKVPRQKLSSGQ